MNSASNVSPELQVLLSHRLRATEGPTLRGAAMKLPTGSLPSRILVSRKSTDAEIVCSPSNRSPQGRSTWPARPPVLKQRARTSAFSHHSAMNTALTGMDWTTSKAAYWDSQANEDVVKDLSNKLRQTQQGNKEVYAQIRQLREECRQYGERNSNLMDTQKGLLDNQRLVRQECAEFAALNKSLMESHEKLQEDCSQYEVEKRRLASEISDFQAQNHTLTESHMEECRDFMAHERDLMASQARLMDDYKVKEAEYDILQHDKERLQHAQKRLSDEYKEQLEQNSDLVEDKDGLLVECVAYKAKLAEALLTIEKQGIPEKELPQSEPDPEADMECELNEAEQQQAWPQEVEVRQLGLQGNPQADGCSEGRLRRVLTNHNSTTEELRQALAAVDSLMSEARRELAVRELRERRAGYEQLHQATEGRDASTLEEAIAVSRRVGVDAEEIEKAEGKLEVLKSISDEERAAQEAQREHIERKRRSFQLVKQGKALALRELLGCDGSKDAGSKSWVQWKDHSGRTLLSYAKELRVATVQECLERMMSNDNEMAEPVEPSMPPQNIIPLEEISEELPTMVVTCKSQRPSLATEDLPEGCSPQHVNQVTTPALAPWSPKSSSTKAVAKSDSEWPETCAKLRDSLLEVKNPPVPEESEAASDLSAKDQESLRLQAFKAVVKDDTVTLADVLAQVPRKIWSSWQNKATKDLLTLAQERRSPASYSMMAKELGILQERKRESFEERETVWVFLPGEVQARHATVLQDTSAEATEVLVQFWDSDGPPSKVDHALVMKTA
mmetsp:Transcript_78027/g.150749  ORF Transcript_78027/g.150749 Transcript_78027/m.150749 type:complete len:787 (-) Transcript_78027:147-2507(-)